MMKPKDTEPKPFRPYYVPRWGFWVVYQGGHHRTLCDRTERRHYTLPDDPDKDMTLDGRCWCKDKVQGR